MSGIILIGSSISNIKTINIDANFENNIYIVSKNNWIGEDNTDEIFEIKINDGVCICKRTDSNSGWEFELLINASIYTDSSDTKTIPIFFINLDKDKDRLVHMENLLYKIFTKNNIYRIKGVEHKIGMEGCRLAHINAHISAINKGYDYYLIAEDDIQPLVDINNIQLYINNSTTFNPDLVLFEQGNGPACDIERFIQLKKVSENMYRIFGGGSGTGCYFCSKNFGLKLIKFWIKRPGDHIDNSWQQLWKSNNVYFHRPQLFHQREGYSNQNDVYYRQAQIPFRWELYELANSKRKYKCSRPKCEYFINSYDNYSFEKYCCIKCNRNGKHGPRCEKIPFLKAGEIT